MIRSFQARVKPHALCKVGAGSELDLQPGPGSGSWNRSGGGGVSKDLLLSVSTCSSSGQLSDVLYKDSRGWTLPDLLEARERAALEERGKLMAMLCLCAMLGRKAEPTLATLRPVCKSLELTGGYSPWWCSLRWYWP